MQPFSPTLIGSLLDCHRDFVRGPRWAAFFRNFLLIGIQIDSKIEPTLAVLGETVECFPSNAISIVFVSAGQPPLIRLSGFALRSIERRLLSCRGPYRVITELVRDGVEFSARRLSNRILPGSGQPALGGAS